MSTPSQVNNLSQASLSKESLTQQQKNLADNFEETLRGIIAQILPGQQIPIHSDSKLKEDLGLDSLDMVELIMICEKDFFVTLPDEKWNQIETVAELEKVVKEEVLGN
ncbi:MAG: acyl carrier protein [Bacteroidota bacterium]